MCHNTCDWSCSSSGCNGECTSCDNECELNSELGCISCGGPCTSNCGSGCVHDNCEGSCEDHAGYCVSGCGGSCYSSCSATGQDIIMKTGENLFEFCYVCGGNTMTTYVEEFSESQDINKNGVIDDDELTVEQKLYRIQAKMNLKDVNKLFVFIYAFTLLFLVIKFCSWFFFRINVNISSDKLAMCLNLFIVIVGSCEGFRSFMKTATGDTNMPVPSWKLQYLFNYLVSFAVLTVISVALEFTVKFTADPTAVIDTLPTFSSDEFLDGVVSNVVAYLAARYGNKISENINLSKIKMFKK